MIRIFVVNKAYLMELVRDMPLFLGGGGAKRQNVLQQRSQTETLSSNAREIKLLRVCTELITLTNYSNEGVDKIT